MLHDAEFSFWCSALLGSCWIKIALSSPFHPFFNLLLHPVGGLAHSCTQFEGWLLMDFPDDWNTTQAPFSPVSLIP
jgi:hypothetical protein